MKEKSPGHSAGEKGTVTTFKRYLSSFAFFLFAFVASVLLVITLGLSERISMHVGILTGLVLAILLLKLSPFVKKPENYENITIKQSVIFLVAMELLLLTFTPLHSLIPEPVLLKLHILGDIKENKNCNTSAEAALAEKFMSNNVNISKVKIYYGGEPQFLSVFGNLFPKIKASAYGNYIYLADSDTCTSSATLVHELTHVWQYQNGMGFGPGWVPYWIDYYWRYLTNYKSLYDFGGIDGIKKALSEGKTLKDFGLEQQANIVEAYYIILSTSYLSGNSRIARPESFNILKTFMDQTIKI